jgi:hypothetical protein
VNKIPEICPYKYAGVCPEFHLLFMGIYEAAGILKKLKAIFPGSTLK